MVLTWELVWDHAAGVLLLAEAGMLQEGGMSRRYG